MFKVTGDALKGDEKALIFNEKYIYIYIYIYTPFPRSLRLFNAV